MNRKFLKVLILLYASLPFLGLVFVIINDNFLNPGFSESIKFAIFMTCIGITLCGTGFILLSVNKKKDGNFVSSAPYAGKVEGLTKLQALIANWSLIILGLICLLASTYAFFIQ